MQDQALRDHPQHGHGHWQVVAGTPGAQNNSPVTSKDDAIVDVIIPAYITVVKSAVPENGTPFDYTASGAGLHPDDQTFTLAPGDPQGDRSRTLVVEPAAGGTEYTIDEQTTAGWSLEDITCEGAQSETTTPSTGEAKVTVKPGDTATCTYSNERLGSLTIRKIVQPQSSGQKFAFTATGVTPDAFSLGNEEEQVFSALPTGTDVSVTETSQDDWALSSIVRLRRRPGRSRQQHHVDGGEHHRRGLHVCEPGDSEGATDRGQGRRPGDR